jgi:3-phosphoshikimate 1-carboxyvinyltransferase
MGDRPAGARFLPAVRGLTGTLRVPGDKSISHRAVLFGAVNDGPVTVTGFLRGADTLATVRAVRALGVLVEQRGDDLLVHGAGWDGLREPEDVIDVANAGTLIRLLPGLVAARSFLSVFTGDASIRRRPMGRILQPLRAMGATVAGRAGDSLPPFSIRGGGLRGMRHELAVASAQIKSCLLLAGLQADGKTTVVEPGRSRDHTERMIRFGGGHVHQEAGEMGGQVVTVSPVERLKMSSVAVPGDFSSAAFPLVATLLVPESEVTLEQVGLNPTRTGLLDILLRMGARLAVQPGETPGPEPAGSITAWSSALTATDVGPDEVPNVIDELPLFLLAAARAEGVSHLRGAAELRAKESDRLLTMTRLLRGLGVEITEHRDGMDVAGDPRGWRGGGVTSSGDHRIAMVGAVAGLASHEGTQVDDIDCISVSFPGFVDTLRRMGGDGT